MNGILPPLKPIAIKERNSIAFLRYGELDADSDLLELVRYTYLNPVRDILFIDVYTHYWPEWRL